MTTETNVWFNTPTVLWEEGRLTEFFPTKEQTTTERYNSLMRLALYMSIILFVYHRDYRFLYIAVGMGALTYYLYTHSEKPSVADSRLPLPANAAYIEKFEEPVECTKPTMDNPFMNVTMKDYLNIKDGRIVDRPPACNMSDPNIKKSADEFFDNNLYKDVSDVFGNMNSQRQFFTMPWTEIPNRQGEFAKWLYDSPATCKENQDYCLRYEDVRSKSSQGLLIDPDKNPTRK